MDIATHALVPYACALALLAWRRPLIPLRERVAWSATVAVAGAAPDLDTLLRPLELRWEALYWLQHRGLSHSLVGAPLFALLAVGALALLARRWPARLDVLRWRRATLPLLVVGSWTHLVLDGVTLSGVPLLFPLSERRFSLEVFHWLVDVLFPVSALLLVAHVFGKLSPRRVMQGGALVVVVLLALGGARLAERPSADDAYPRASLREWIVVAPEGNGTLRASLAGGADAVWYADDAASGETPAAAREAIALAASTSAFHGFHLGSYGPIATHVERAGEGWRVAFIDAAQRYEATHAPGWTPTSSRSEWGLETFDVQGGVATETHRGW